MSFLFYFSKYYLNHGVSGRQKKGPQEISTFWALAPVADCATLQDEGELRLEVKLRLLLNWERECLCWVTQVRSL